MVMDNVPDICLECGGTGVESAPASGPEYGHLRGELQPLWDKQMRNRPEIHRAIDALLAYSVSERLESLPSLGEFVEYLLAGCLEDSGDIESAAQMPTKERGRVYREVLLGLLERAAEIVWFLANQGYPKRNSVRRMIQIYKKNQEVSDEDPDPDSGWSPSS